MPVYEIPPRYVTHDVNGRPMHIIASFWARSWPAAIKAELAIMGWLKETP